MFHPDSDPLEPVRVRLVRRIWPKQSIACALDIGCGSGYLCRQWADRGMVGEIHGVDLASERVKQARAQLPAGHFSVQKADALSYEPRRFDLVSIVEALEHMPDPDAVLREAARVSSKYVLVTVPYRENTEAAKVICPHCLNRFHPAGHLHGFDERSLAERGARAGLKSVRWKVQCYLRVRGHAVFSWIPDAVWEGAQFLAWKAGLIQGTFLGMLFEVGPRER